MKATARGRRLLAGAALTVVWLVPACVPAPPASSGRMSDCQPAGDRYATYPCVYTATEGADAGLSFMVGTDGSVTELADSRLPVCAVEDGSAGQLPCRWDGGPNNTGLHYVIRADGTVWSLDGADWLGDMFGEPGGAGGR